MRFLFFECTSIVKSLDRNSPYIDMFNMMIWHSIYISE